MTKQSKTEDPEETAHLDELPDGIGCAEIWEHLSDERDDDDADV